jgi:hypothetical protein
MPAQYEYKIIKESSHGKLAKAINAEAVNGWEPINAYVWGLGTAYHCGLLRRPLKVGS